MVDGEHEAEIASAVSRVLAIEAAPNLDLSALATRLCACLVQQVGAVIEQAERRVDRIELHVDGDDYFFLGHAGSTCRLVLHIVFDLTTRGATVTIRATKGNRDAIADVGWGERGPDVGNSLLIACVIHVGMVELRRGGVRAIVNQPYDESLRAYYTLMGFRDGERLDLDDAAALARAFGFIAEVYTKHARHGISLGELST